MMNNEDVSQLPVRNNFSLQMENNTLSDFDDFLMRPLSPMNVDTCDTYDDSSLMYPTSNFIPVATSNGTVGSTANLSWLDLTLSPSSQNMSHHGDVEMENETPTALYPPSDFSEAMDFCV